uniref:CMP/dCMP-type deaminase domain-containing protein n=1 Tax=Myotis myotis TaxID=51298 RepID=A0A7J7Z591_MYOMY|nr:hypothetical protein mMyoMyo1_010765 [Myotis myotis]
MGTGVFENEFYPKKPVHTEICFLNWFKTQQAFLAQNLSREEKYHVTWFMSWSPCFQCARQVVTFLKDHKYVQLSIFVARLYYSSRPQYQQGLRSLQGAGAQVAIMTPADFAYCWDIFVDDPLQPFRYWKGIYLNSCSLSKTLVNILRNLEKDFPKPGPVSRNAAPAPGTKGNAAATGNQESTLEPLPGIYPKTFYSNFKNLEGYWPKSTRLCFEVETWEDGSFLDYQNGVFRNQLPLPLPGPGCGIPQRRTHTHFLPASRLL